MRQHFKILLTIFAAFQLLLYPLRADQVGYFVFSGGAAGSAVVHNYVQSCAFTGGSSDASDTCTFGSALGAHHIMYGCIQVNAGTKPTISWSGDSGTFISDVSLTGVGFQYGGGGSYLYCNYILNTGGGGTGITVTGVSGPLSFSRLWMDEYTGIGTLDTEDALPYATGTGTTATSNSITTALNGELVLATTTWAAGGTISAGSPFTLSATASNSALEYYKQTTVGAISTTMTTTASSPNWCIHIIAFK